MTIKKKIRNNCSKILEMVLGATLNFPRKYPFKIEEMLIKGSVAAIAHIKGVTLGCFNKYLDITGARNRMNIIKTALNNKMKQAVENTMVLLRILFSLTNLEMLIGRANVAMVIKRE